MPVRRTNRYTSRSSNRWNRSQRRHFANGKPWTPTEVKTLRKIYRDTPTKEIARRFRRSISSVQAKAGDLGLKKTKIYLKKMCTAQWR